jgi:hypothetical protein
MPELNCQRSDSYIQTYSGLPFWPLDPRVEDVKIVDIAHALSNMCRFNGHCKTFYSVAQHSVLVARQLEKNGATLTACKAALLHDAAEAYIPDVCRPIKHAWKELVVIEARLLKVIFEAFDISISSDTIFTIKHYDNVLLHTEARDLMYKPSINWKTLPEPLEQTIIAQIPRFAKQVFLHAWKRYD